MYVNDALVKMLGYKSQDELLEQKAITRYRDPFMRTQFLRELTKNGQVDKFELEVLKKDNTPINILMNAHIEEDILSGMVIDVTESKKAMEEIKEFSYAMAEIADIIMIADRSGRLTFVNDAYVKKTGYTKEESVGKTASIVKSGLQDKGFYQDMWQIILNGEVYRGEIINRKKNGEVYHEAKTITPIKDKDDNIISFVSTGKDITDVIEMQEKLEKMASIDHLTGIYNRHKFEELFNIEEERTLRYGSPLSIMMFDIDHFKKVNDIYGHDIGDLVLKNVVDIINKQIRQTDIFTRWGGEEFVILCPGINGEEASLLAGKLRHELEVHSFDKVGTITASFGVSSYEKNESKDRLLKRVDNALYQAKETGRNRVVIK